MTFFSKEQRQEIVASIRRYFAEELDGGLSELQAGFLLEYFMGEIAPFAYNQGIGDAQKALLKMADDLPGTCFHEALTHWKQRPGATRAVRRKTAD